MSKQAPVNSLNSSIGTAFLDHDLTILRCDNVWAGIASRLGRTPVSNVVPGANISQLIGKSLPDWTARYHRALRGEASYDRVVLKGQETGGPPGAATSSWDIYAFPVLDEAGVLSIVEVAINVTVTLESAVLAGLPDVCLVLTKDGFILGCYGGNLVDFFGTPQVLIGAHLRDIVPSAAIGQVDLALAQVEQAAREAWMAHDARAAEQAPARSSPGIEVLDPSETGGVVATIEYAVGNGFESRVYEARFAPLSEPGSIVMVRDVTEARRAQAIQEGQSRFLELLATGGLFTETLRALISMLEEQSPGMSGLILLADAHGKHLHVGASVSLPDDYLQAIDGLEIGPMAGSCGAAAHFKRRIVIDNIDTNPRWEGLRSLALAHGLKACWAQPVIGDDGRILGAFAMYHRTARTPSRVEVRALETAARLVRVAIEQRQAKEKLEAEYARLELRIEERTREIEQRRRVAEGLREILAALNSNRALEDVLDLIMAQAEEFLGAEAAVLYRLEAEGEGLRVVASHNLPPEPYGELRAHITIPVTRDLVGWSVATGRPVVASDTEEVAYDYSWPPELGSAKTRANWWPSWATGRFHSLLAIPLAGKSRIYGSVVLCFSMPRVFSQEELNLAISFADQATLAIENTQLREEAEQAAVAAERSRLARELHDSVTQTLFSASLIAEVLPRLWTNSEADGRKRLEQLRQLTRGALAEMRSLLLELRPATLMEVGLPELLKQLVEATSGRAGIPIELVISDSAACSPPAQVRVALYRIAQEALSNVVKHSAAVSARVELRCENEDLPAVGDKLSVTLIVGDDGRGFDIQSIPAHRLGIRIMHERAAEVGASVAIESRQDGGTEVVARWRGPCGDECLDDMA